MNRILAALLLALCAASASAQQAPVRFQPEPDFEDLVRKGVEAFAPKDAFGGADCRVVDLKTLRPYTFAEAAERLAPCLESIRKRYGVPLSVRPGIVEKTAEGRAVIGLVLGPGRQAAAGTTALRDLNHALALRRDRLMGFRAVLRRDGEQDPRVESLGQAALDRCLVPAVVRKVRTAGDFLSYYGGCLLKDAELKAVAARPLGGGDPLAVAVVSKADAAVLEALNGQVVVNAEDGPVTVLVVSFAAPAEKP